MLALIASALILSAASGDTATSQKNSIKKHKREAAIQTDAATQREREANVFLSATQAAQANIIKLIQAIKDQTEAQHEHDRADDEPWPLLGRLTPVKVQQGLLIVGALYTFFAGWQLLQIRRQANLAKQAADDAREALRLEQRPWLVPTGDAQLGMPSGEIPEGDRIPMRFDLKNTGNTPALQVKISWAYEVKMWDDPMPENEVSSQHPLVLGAIGPGVPQRIPLDLRQFAEATRRQVLDGTYRLTVRGYVEYKDHAALAKPYTTKFSLTWFPGGGITAERRFVIFGPYNDCT
jgi:hypothetical protein